MRELNREQIDLIEEALRSFKPVRAGPQAHSITNRDRGLVHELALIVRAANKVVIH